MHLALALLAVAASPLLLECNTTCQAVSPKGSAGGRCPVTLSPAVPGPDGRVCVAVWVRITADDLKKAPKVEILSPVQKTLRPAMKPKSHNERSRNPRCSSPNSTTAALWELVHDCISATAADVVSVSYSVASAKCIVSARIGKPDFIVSVDVSSKSIKVTVNPEKEVFVRLCYLGSALICEGLEEDLPLRIDPSKTPSVHLNISSLLPCLCVEVYYTHRDASRKRVCPFQKKRLADVRDVWLTSDLVATESSVEWRSACCLSELPVRVSASLCWRLSERVCTPIHNSTLQGNEDGNTLKYNTSAVDKHPQMCLLFSLQGSQKVRCPFKAGESSWEVGLGRGSQGVSVRVTTDESAAFSAQLCVLHETGCAPMGPVHGLTAEDTPMNIPADAFAELCVQVWQSDPALNGRRILCPDYTRSRWGVCAAAALICVLLIILLGIFIHRLRSGAAGWLYIHHPVLLVCSSEHSAHVYASCALASILQGELSATVHLALWAQTSQRQAGAGVADVGPIPWLYGQWDAVRQAQGKVLIVWSPEAKTTYEKWSEERSVVDKRGRRNEDNSRAQLRHEGIKADAEADSKLSEILLKSRKEKDDWGPHREASTVTGPVFAAALACLQGALQQSAPGVAIVYFQGLGHSRDIPPALRGLPRYCLPQEFRGLIQELQGMGGALAQGCRPRLLPKVLSLWLAQRLAGRLQALLPQSQAEKMQHVSRFTSLIATDFCSDGNTTPW